jgi:hypothetical protein
VAVDVLRSRSGFGTCAFHDEAFPDWPTFYLVGRLHFEIFGALYPLPWPGAHQDPWIADVYRPWQASEIDDRIQVHNRIGSATYPVAAPRFPYGDPPTEYRAAVLAGRRRVNDWLASHPDVAKPLTADILDHPCLL